MPWVGWNFRKEDFFCALVPKRKLRLARTEQISEELVMVLSGTSAFNDMAFPGNGRIKLWERIFPPPNFIALPIAAENDVLVSIAIDVVHGPAGLDGEKVCFDNVTVPTHGFSAIPNERGSNLAKTDNKIV